MKPLPVPLTSVRPAATGQHSASGMSRDAARPNTPDAVTGKADGRNAKATDLETLDGPGAAPVTRRRVRLMREPTPEIDVYAWHRAAMAGQAPAASPDEPQCGWFKRRLVKGGPFVPARIWLYQPIDDETGELCGDELLQCEVNGEYRDPVEEWSWLCGNPISRAEFEYMTALTAWTTAHEPEHPAADPRRPIDNLKTPLHF